MSDRKKVDSENPKRNMDRLYLSGMLENELTGTRILT
jgi:hypothetical protein